MPPEPLSVPEPLPVVVEKLEPQVTKAPEVELEMAAFSEVVVFDGKLPLDSLPFWFGNVDRDRSYAGQNSGGDTAYLSRLVSGAARL